MKSSLFLLSFLLAVAMGIDSDVSPADMKSKKEEQNSLASGLESVWNTMTTSTTMMMGDDRYSLRQSNKKRVVRHRRWLDEEPSMSFDFDDEGDDTEGGTGDVVDVPTVAPTLFPGETVPTAEVPTEEGPTDGIPTEEVPTDGVPTEEVPTDGVPTEEVPTDGLPTEEFPTDEVPTGEIPTTDALVPSEEEPTEEVPTEEVPTDGVPTDLLPTEEVPTEEVPTGEIPTDGVPTEEIPTDGVPTEEVPTDGLPTDESPTDEFPTGEAPTDGLPTGEFPTGEFPTGEFPTETGFPTLSPVAGTEGGFITSPPTLAPFGGDSFLTAAPVGFGVTSADPTAVTEGETMSFSPTPFPTLRPSVAFIPPTTPVPTMTPTKEGEKGFPGEPEVIEEVEKDKQLQILLGVVAGLGLAGMLFTAYQVMENPDGLCASVCRLSIKLVICLYKILCLPCRFACGRAGKSNTHMPAPTLDAMEMPQRRDEVL